MPVYCVFNISGDGSGIEDDDLCLNVYDLIGLAGSVESALEIAKQHLSSKFIFAHDLAHPKMTAENSYTFFGFRTDCTTSSSWTNRGYVIEMMPVQ